jgi:hypothetical protein
METFSILDHCKSKKIKLAFECDIPQPPKVDNEMIRFNGVGNEGHETFIMFKKKPVEKICSDKSRYFYFCKTARKPYDLAVCLVLLSLVQNAPKSVEISSDGDWNVEWAEARKVYKELFGTDISGLKEAA